MPQIALGEPIAEFRHNITFRTIRGRVYSVETAIPHLAVRWFEFARLPNAAISQLARKIIQKLSP